MWEGARHSSRTRNSTVAWLRLRGGPPPGWGHLRMDLFAQSAWSCQRELFRRRGGSLGSTPAVYIEPGFRFMAISWAPWNRNQAWKRHLWIQDRARGGPPMLAPGGRQGHSEGWAQGRCGLSLPQAQAPEGTDRYWPELSHCCWIRGCEADVQGARGIGDVPQVCWCVGCVCLSGASLCAWAQTHLSR